MLDIPVETWSSIFEMVLEQEDTISARIRLLKINSLWRSIAYETPQLWTNLRIHKNEVSQAEFYLQHSGALPVDVHLEILDLSPNTDTSALTEILSNHLNRIRSLCIHAQQHDYADKLLAQIGAGQHAPILEFICVKIDQEVREIVPGFAALQSAFQSTPRLLRLHLPAYPLPSGQSPLFSNPSLTHLTLDATLFYANLNCDTLFNVIGAVSGYIQGFTFHGSDDFSYADTSNFPTLNLPHLTEVHVSAPGWGLDILDTFHAPALTKVLFDARRQKEYHEIEEWTLEYSEPITTSLRHLSARSPQIKQLELFGTALQNPKDDYTWLFGAAFPMIEVLRFVETDITDDLLVLATVENMPRLRILEVHK